MKQCVSYKTASTSLVCIILSLAIFILLLCMRRINHFGSGALHPVSDIGLDPDWKRRYLFYNLRLQEVWPNMMNISIAGKLVRKKVALRSISAILGIHVYISHLKFVCHSVTFTV